MRSLLRSLLPCLALSLPLSAAATNDYSPSIKPAQYQPLDPADPSVVTLTWTGTAIHGLTLPFPVVYFGDVFNQINVSTFGYASFSSRPGFDDLAGGRADPEVAANQHPLPDLARPNGVIAPWWDDLRCPAGSIKTREAVIEGSPTFTIEWNGCYRDPAPSATLQMQLRFTAGSSIVRVFYGALGAGGTHSASVGLENPVRWRKDENQVWQLVATGGTQGETPALGCAAAGCGAAQWPANTMIQYGRPATADLQGGTNPSTNGFGIELTGLGGTGAVTLDFENSIENGGLTAATGVTWDYYISTDDSLDPATDTLLPCGHAVPESFPAVTTRTFAETCTATLAPGFYYLCTYVDPPTPTAPEGAVVEANETNNAYCTREFVVGADVTGTVDIPVAGVSAGTLTMPLHVENRGSASTPQFRAQIWFQDCNNPDPAGNVLAWETTLTLAGGSAHDEVASVFVRPDSDGTQVCAVLVLDPDLLVPELDEANNTYSTCVAHGPLPKSCASITRPDLRVNQLTTQLPLGCYFGEWVELGVEICNDEPLETSNFGLAFYVDVNPTATILDTMILSVPQACSGPQDCTDLGGGPPGCIEGICQAPCLVDADCGGGGLECEPSFLVPGKTCQLVMPGNSCRWIRAVSDIPTFNERLGVPFADEKVIFSVILDWTDDVTEVNEGGDNKRTGEPMFCWTRKPDLQAVELRTLPALASGEVVPVYRRVRNAGSTGGAFSYRYVLSDDPAISEWDLHLEVVGAGELGSATVEPRSDQVDTDLVLLPAGIVPGTYYLGLILDPLAEVVELAEDNNTAATAAVEVVASSLRVVTSALRDATVGADYTVQFLAAGGSGGYLWSVAEGELPPGLQLDAGGLLHGTVLEPGIYLFTLEVVSAGSSARAVFALEASPAAGPLRILANDLPPALLGHEFRVLLGASGGLPPYTWECAARPPWLHLQNNLLFGTPLAVAPPVAFTCTVADANGSRASRTFVLAVYDDSVVRIRSPQFGSGDIGRPWTACVSAEGGSGRYDWSADPATLPAGLAFEERDNTGCLTGVPESCGAFAVAVTAVDEETHLRDSRRLSATVVCNELRLVTRAFPLAERKVAYEFQLQADATGPVNFELVGGELPAGIELASDGRLSGTVAVDARTGPHAAAVRLTGPEGGAGLDVVAIDVRADAPPAVTKTHTEKTTGCSASGEGRAALAPLAAVLALLALLGRRRRAARPLAAGLLVTGLLFPAAASAQTPGYATYHRARPYEPLQNASQLNPSGSNTAFWINLNGWTVPFYGENFPKFLVHENGLIFFSTNYTATTTYRIPYSTSTTPRHFIAGWWDDHDMKGRPGSWLWKVRGAAPNREVVFEWNWITSTTSDGNDSGQHQISIFEDGTISIRWGHIVDSGKVANTHQAAIGLMDALGSPRSVPFLACSTYTRGGATAPDCDSQDWNDQLRDTELVFTTKPNLQVRETSTSFEGLAGLEQTFRATIYNHGPFQTPAAPVRFYVSADPILSDDDVEIGTSAPIEVAPFAEREVELTAVLPRQLDETHYFLLALADPDDTVREFVEDDNAGGEYFFRVVEARPDLVVERLGTPASGSPGATFTFDLTVGNLGNLDAVDVPFRLVLSENEAVTATDPALYEDTVSVGWRGTAERSYTATIPADVPPGVYRVGVVIDPEGTVQELDKLNNVFAGERELAITSDGLVVPETRDFSVRIGSELCIPLVARGGDGVYSWSVVAGELPPGLDLVPGVDGGTSLCGRPTALGLYDFTLEVLSANLGARAQFSIEVTADQLALGIAVHELPLARFEVPYEAGLAAFGGAGPFRWTILNGAFPAGLALDEDGLLFGTALEAGTFEVEVQVTDSADRTARGIVSLLVVPPPRVTCSSRTLGVLRLGDPVSGRLHAAGGPGTYDWRTLETRRIDDANGLPIDESAPPPGLLLTITGELQRAPTQVGRYLWTVEAKATSGDEADTCTLTVDVVDDGGLAVSTVGLPAAVPGEEYRVRLQATGGVGDLVWNLADGAALPEGLSLDSTGVISGTPSATGPGEEPSHTFGFRVEVRDERNVKGVGSLALTVAPEGVGTITVVERKEDEGCQAAGGGFSLAGLTLVLAALAGRRRANWLGTVAACALGASLVACSGGTSETTKTIEADLCVELGVSCGDPATGVTCDPADAVCKCGGHGGVVCGPGTVCHLDDDTTPPTPTCVSPLCDGVRCPGNESCDATDGLCKCNGVVCGDGLTCGADGLCLHVDPCSGRTCAPGETCDPADGICKCGGSICSAGESCRASDGVEGCVGRKCVGVNCGEGTVCNPVDGLCHCGDGNGDACARGQACDLETGRCVEPSPCEGVVCGGNTTCSPLDGQCRCGGYDATAPICAADQTCDLGQNPPRCVGGDACAGVVCEDGANLHCDGETGECKCGGTFGVSCAPEDGCVDSGGQPTCVTPCDPNADNVAVEACEHTAQVPKACYFSPADGLAYCTAPGSAGDGDPCESPTDCASGHHCALGADGGRCRRYCDTTAANDCYQSDRSCVPLSGRPAGLPNLGVCMLVNP